MKITQHPANKTTELPLSIYKRRNWKLLGYYKDHLTLGHYLSSLFGDVYYLILNNGYGTLADALIDNRRDIVTTDKDETEILTVSSQVRQTFRVVDIVSPAQKLGQFDVIISSDFEDFDNPNDLDLFVNFTDRHKPRYVCLLVNEFKSSLDEWCLKFTNAGFEYKQEMIKNIQDDLKNKLTVLSLDNLILFTKEREHAWCREDA